MKNRSLALALVCTVGLGSGCGEPQGDSLALGSARSSSAAAGPFRAVGTEPFWGLMIDDTGVRFTTPDDTLGIRFPPHPAAVAGDTLRWVGKTERAVIDARIWPGRCSDGMSDKVWPYAAVVRIDGTVYEGCAEGAPGTSGGRRATGS